MADSALVRVQGPVINIEVRTGTARESGNPYRIETVRVLSESKGIAEFTVPDQEPHRFAEGEDVDATVEYTVRAGRLSGRLQSVRALASASS